MAKIKLTKNELKKQISSLKTAQGNIAGVAIPIFVGAKFTVSHYDLLSAPLYLGDQQTSADVRGKLAKRGLTKAAGGSR